MNKMTVLLFAASLLILITSTTFAVDVPNDLFNDTNGSHPNVAAAQKLVKKAYTKLSAAKKANEFDAAGHTQKAMDLLSQAKAELKLAAKATAADSFSK